MFDFDGLNRVIGTPEMLARGTRYDGERRPDRSRTGRTAGQR